MTCSISLQLLSVRSLSSEAVRAVLEVIVRTPRLLSTSKQKYTSEPFSVQSARGVSLHWTQAKSSKAYVRLLLLPEETPPEADAASAAAAAAVAAAAACGVSASRRTATVTTGCCVAPPMTVAAPVAMVVRGPAVAVPEGANYQKVRRSSEALLQLRVGEKQQQQQGMQGVHPAPTAVAAQVQQLTLVFEPAEASTGNGEQSSGYGGGGDASGAPSSAATAVDLELIVFAGAKSGAVGGASGAADSQGAFTGLVPAAAAAAAAASCTSTQQAWAWAEVASPPAALPSPAAEPSPAQPTAPRKRSWLAALGLGRQATSGSIAATAVTAASVAVSGAAAAGAEGDRAGAGDGSTAPMDCGGGGAVAGGVAGGENGVAALGEPSSLATSAWDPVAALSLATTTATVTTTTVATVSSSSQSGHGSAPAAVPYRFQETGGELAQWAAPPPPPPAVSHGRLPRTAPLEAVGNLSGCATAAAAASSPFSTLSLAAAAAPVGLGMDALMLGTAAAAGTGLPAATAMTAAPSGCSEPQAPKRRRLGEIFARLFQPSSSNNQVRRITATEDSASSIGPFGGAMDGTATRAAAPPASLAKPPLRRLSTPPGLTLVPPPSPQLGDVYRVQDNALTSDTAVQIGFASASEAAAAATAMPAPIVDLLLPGLESPGYGESSPAGGPDRLTIPPPVESMAAASLASPRATSPGALMGGCFFWRYGAAARARVAAAVAAAAADADVAILPPPGASGLGRAGSAPVPAVAVAAAGNAAGGRQLNTLSAGDALPAATVSYTSGTGCSTGNHVPNHGQPGSQHLQGCCSQTGHQTLGSGAGNAAAVAASWSHPLAGEISRVVEFVNAQNGLEEVTRALALSQCQFLLDCLRNPDMCWLVGDSLLQLKREVGFPFDTGVPIAGASGWFRLVLQHAVPTAATAPGGSGRCGGGAAAAATTPAAAAGAEVLKVRWACIDQRQVGGTNACAAIGLEVAAWCLGAVQRWREALAAASAASGSCNLAGAGGGSGRRDSSVWPQPLPYPDSSPTAGGGGGRRDLAPALSRSQRDRERLALSVELDSMNGSSLEQCIRLGTEVWQAVLVQSPAARVASSTGDFDLEHMLQLGGYSLRLRLADYSAASLLEDGGVSGGGVSGGGSAAATVEPPPPPASEHLAKLSASSGCPLRPPSLQLPPDSDLGDKVGSVVAAAPPPPLPSARSLRAGPQCGLPTFAALVRSLAQGVYVLGWRGHFATLWLRPGCVVHLIDSLGARLAADCPLAFILEFNTPADFLVFFLARHQARRDAAAADDISGANMAALIEVHRLELLHPAVPAPAL